MYIAGTIYFNLQGNEVFSNALYGTGVFIMFWTIPQY